MLHSYVISSYDYPSLFPKDVNFDFSRCIYPDLTIGLSKL